MSELLSVALVCAATLLAKETAVLDPDDRRRIDAELDDRLAARTATMFADGLVEEVQGLVDVGLLDGVTARRAITEAGTGGNIATYFQIFEPVKPTTVVWIDCLVRLRCLM